MTQKKRVRASVHGSRDVPADSAAQLRKVSHHYPRAPAPALQNVSLTFPTGAFTAIIGPSGAGKSTLLRTLNGLVRPSSGEVWVAGTEVSRVAGSELRRVRRSVGMVFQNFNLVRRLSALENVLLGRLGAVSLLRSSLNRYSREDNALAWRLLERVGLADHAWQRADTLSGGQQQRVGIARALAQRPQLILADEPISSLDARSAEQVMVLLRDLALEEKIAVIASLHFLDAVHDYADWVVGLRHGGVVFEGREAELTPAVKARLYGEKGARSPEEVRERGPPPASL